MRLIILKIGSSILRDAKDLPRAVHEIYRWKREGYAVLAVVSAFAGETDARWERCLAQRPPLDDFAKARDLSDAEHEATHALHAALDRAGLFAKRLTPLEIELRGEGPALEACPRSVDPDRIRASLREHDIAIVPGFSAVDAEGRTVLLGRGGSDWSALFLARSLRARCRLLKDVDGLYEADPHTKPSSRRYERARWSDVRRCSRELVQQRALEFAEAAGFPFEIAAPAADHATLVGEGTPVLLAPSAPKPPLRVVLLGAGNVGRGVAEHLLRETASFTLEHVAIRSPDTPREIARGLLTTEWQRVAGSGTDVVVEAIGGRSTARRAILAALRAGSHVVTANKSVLAAHGPELHAAAERAGRRVLCGAAVGGALPILEQVERREQRLLGTRAVLNGTSNFVLERLSDGYDIDTAIEQARLHGLAESSASRDLEGVDAAEKLVILARRAGLELALEDVDRSGTRRSSWGALRPGVRARQIARLRVEGGRADARIALEPLSLDDRFAVLEGEANACELLWSDGATSFLRGRGAGRWPSSEAVLGDLYELARDFGRTEPRRIAVASSQAIPL